MLLVGILLIQLLVVPENVALSIGNSADETHSSGLIEKPAVADGEVNKSDDTAKTLVAQAEEDKSPEVKEITSVPEPAVETVHVTEEMKTPEEPVHSSVVEEKANAAEHPISTGHEATPVHLSSGHSDAHSVEPVNAASPSTSEDHQLRRIEPITIAPPANMHDRGPGYPEPVRIPLTIGGNQPTVHQTAGSESSTKPVNAPPPSTSEDHQLKRIEPITIAPPANMPERGPGYPEPVRIPLTIGRNQPTVHQTAGSESSHQPSGAVPDVDSPPSQRPSPAAGREAYGPQSLGPQRLPLSDGKTPHGSNSVRPETLPPNSGRQPYGPQSLGPERRPQQPMRNPQASKSSGSENGRWVWMPAGSACCSCQVESRRPVRPPPIDVKEPRRVQKFDFAQLPPQLRRLAMQPGRNVQPLEYENYAPYRVQERFPRRAVY